MNRALGFLSQSVSQLVNSDLGFLGSKFANRVKKVLVMKWNPDGPLGPRINEPHCVNPQIPFAEPLSLTRVNYTGGSLEFIRPC